MIQTICVAPKGALFAVSYLSQGFQNLSNVHGPGHRYQYNLGFVERRKLGRGSPSFPDTQPHDDEEGAFPPAGSLSSGWTVCTIISCQGSHFVGNCNIHGGNNRCTRAKGCRCVENLFGAALTYLIQADLRWGGSSANWRRTAQFHLYLHILTNKMGPISTNKNVVFVGLNENGDGHRC